MTQATPNQFEELGSIKENVRHNEKAIDEIKGKLNDIEKRLTSFQFQFYGGVLILLTVNVILKYLP